MVREMYDALMRSRATLTLMGIIVLAYLIEALSPELVLDLAEQTGALVAGGEHYRLLSATFVHLPPPRIDHVLSNLLWLAVIGPAVETMLGKGWYLVVYLLSALGGSVLSYVFLDPQTPTVGASGAVFGLIGVIAVARPREHREWTVAVLVLSVLFTIAYPEINWIAHVGGAVTGALLAVALVHVRQQSRAIAGLAVGLGILAAGTWIVDMRTAAVAEESSGLAGRYTMALTPISCTGFATCAQDAVERDLTISECDDARCTVTAPGWTAPSPLTRSSSGIWRATGAMAGQYSGTCSGQPTSTSEIVELSDVAFADGVSTLRGTLRRETPAALGCSAASSTWGIVGTR